MNKDLPIISVILAGGKGERMGGLGKSSILLSDIPLIKHVIKRIDKQVDKIIINGPLGDESIANLGYEIVPDIFTDKNGAGPLAGIHTGLKKAYQIHGSDCFLLSVPTDGPFLPKNLSERLKEGFLFDEKSKISISSSNGRTHPTTAMWSTSLLKSLEESLKVGIRKIDKFTCNHKTNIFEWNYYPDPFFNINTLEDLKKAEKIYNDNSI